MTFLNVLLVEDEAIFREDLKYVILAAGFCRITGEADRADRALEIFYEKHPDVIILDIKLKDGETGLDVLECLKNEDVSIIIISAYHLGSRVLQEQYANVSACFSKPVLESEIVDALTELHKRIY